MLIALPNPQAQVTSHFQMLNGKLGEDPGDLSYFSSIIVILLILDYNITCSVDIDHRSLPLANLMTDNFKVKGRTHRLCSSGHSIPPLNPYTRIELHQVSEHYKLQRHNCDIVISKVQIPLPRTMKCRYGHQVGTSYFIVFVLLRCQ